MASKHLPALLQIDNAGQLEAITDQYGKNSMPTLTVNQRAAGATGVAGVTAGGGLVGPSGATIGGATVVSTGRAIAAADDGAILACSTALTLTIPAGLSPRPSFVVDCPPTGNVSIAVSGGALINGATSTLTRARSSNQAGFAVLAHQDADSYGVSGS